MLLPSVELATLAGETPDDDVVVGFFDFQPAAEWTADTKVVGQFVIVGHLQGPVKIGFFDIVQNGGKINTRRGKGRESGIIIDFMRQITVADRLQHEMFKLKHRAVGQQHPAFNHIFQLTHISRPIKFFQGEFGRGINTAKRLAEFPAELH